MKDDFLRVPYGSTVHGEEEIQAVVDVLKTRNDDYIFYSLEAVGEWRKFTRPFLCYCLRQSSRDLICNEFKTLATANEHKKSGI